MPKHSKTGLEFRNPVSCSNLTLMFKIVLFAMQAAVALAAIGAIFVLARWLMKVLVLIGGALLIAIAVGLSASSAGGFEESDGGMAAGTLAFPVALVCLIAWKGLRTKGRQKRDLAGADVQTIRHKPERGDAPYAGPIEPAADAAVSMAWNKAAAMLSGDSLAPIHAARASCSELLLVARGEGLDFDTVDCACVIRRNLPELIVRTEALWGAAAPAEREGLAAGLREDLLRLGQMAVVRLDRHREALRDDLTAIRQHLAGRSEG